MKRSVGGHRRRPRGGSHHKTLVFLADGRALGPFQVDNLSSAGALLTGACPLAVGTSVTLELGHERIPKVEGKVVRTEHRLPGRFSFAVAFLRVPTEVEDMIHEVVLESLEASRARGGPAVLVIASVPEDRLALKRELEALGHRVVCAGTPLDALRWLQDPHLQVEIAMVDVRVGKGSGLDLLAFLAEDFPEVRRVVMALESDAAASGVHPGRTQSVLHKPWVREDLACALGLGRTDASA